MEPLVGLVENKRNIIRIKNSHKRYGSVNNMVLMSCESKPDVISTPMQHKNRKMYIRRRLGFIQNRTLS